MMLFSRILALTALCATAVGTVQGATILGNTADTGIDSSSGVRPATSIDELARTGSSSGRAFVFVFELPNLGSIADPFLNATFSFTLLENGTNVIPGGAFTGGATPSFNLDLYGLGRRDTSPVATGDGYWGATPDPTDATLLAADFLTPATAVGDVTFSGASLNAYLNAQYGGGSGIGDFVFLRINPDLAAGSDPSNNQRYRVSTANNTGTTSYSKIIPQINYDAVPEPSAALALLGGAALLGAIRRRQ
jgi:hypothetical protein